jgi:hypothetical protein
MSEDNNTGRTLIWWSTGAASFVAAQMILREIPEAIIVRCETNNEDPDNYRFEADAMRRLNRSVTLLKSSEYDDVWDVWQKRRFMSGAKGAPCTSAMKIAPRLEFQKPTDLHIFGYTADRKDVERFERLQEHYFELKVRAPLIEAGITKAATLALVQKAGLQLPRSYAMGFPNANCLQTGCVKATSPDYWSLYRHHFPENFKRTAAYAREIGARLTRINDERIFIDEIPDDWPMTNPIIPACDFLCALTEMDLEDKE